MQVRRLSFADLSECPADSFPLMARRCNPRMFVEKTNFISEVHRLAPLLKLHVKLAADWDEEKISGHRFRRSWAALARKVCVSNRYSGWPDIPLTPHGFMLKKLGKKLPGRTWSCRIPRPCVNWCLMSLLGLMIRRLLWRPSSSRWSMMQS